MTTTDAAKEKAKKDQEILSQYKAEKDKYSIFFQKALEIEQELSEHNLVAKTLEKLSGERRCFRKVGGVLIERDLTNVKKDLATEINNLRATLDIVTKTMKQTEDNTTKMEEKYGDIISPSGKKAESKKVDESANKTGSILA